MPTKKDKGVFISAKVPAPIERQLRIAAANMGISKSALLRKIALEALAK